MRIFLIRSCVSVLSLSSIPKAYSLCSDQESWNPWRARTLYHDSNHTTIDIFGIVHHQRYVAQQCFQFIRARKPDVVVLEQNHQSLQSKLSVWKEYLQTNERSLLDLYKWSTYDGMNSWARNRYKSGFDAIAAEIFLTFDALESIGLDPAKVTFAGDLPRSRILELSTFAAHLQENTWLSLVEKYNPNIKEAYIFAEHTYQEHKRIVQLTPEAAKEDLEARRAEYNRFFDQPDNMTYKNRSLRPPITKAREMSIAKMALETNAKHVVIVVGSNHLDGIEQAIKELDGNFCTVNYS